MKRIPLAVLSSTLCLLLAPPIFADAGQRLIPAGSLVSCTTGDGRISSQTTAVGDPILCKVEHRRGDFMLPYGSYLGGEFAEYKDPGHFVGKGYMQLEFDRLYVGDTVVPVDAKVVDVPGYRIDSQGRILGKGHAVRDTITWMIPILWPIDLINLPRRGPRPTLKSETALTLRVMEDIEVPVVPEPQRDPYGLIPRGSQGYAPEPPPPTDDQQQPEMGYNDQQTPEMGYDDQPAPAPAMAYVAPMPVPYAPVYVAPPVVAYAPSAVAYGAMAYARSGYAGYGRVYPAQSYARGYGYGPGVRSYGYGYGARGYAGRSYGGGYGMRSYASSSRGGRGYGGSSRGGYGRR